MDQFIETVRKDHPRLNSEIIAKAYAFAEHAHDGQIRQSNEPFIIHPVHVAVTLMAMELDTDTVAAGLLHDVIEDTQYTLQDITNEFGAEIAQLVDGVTKLDRMDLQSKEEQHAESIRKMFLAMAKDIRVVMIKLADRLHNMQTLQYADTEQQRRVAQETLDIFAPLAHRLGISFMKVALEDLAFRYLMPEEYSQLEGELAGKQKEFRKTIELVKTIIQEHLTQVGIEAQIEGRPKHLYSIHKKMTLQSKSLDQIYDLIAVRIIVDSVKDCYGSLGVVHTLWRPLAKRFKDYVAAPKPNMYQSLHTTVITETGQLFEIQIRTTEMHHTAEYGIAAHWNYKENRSDSDTDGMDGKMKWLRQILEWQNETQDSQEFIDTLKTDLFSDEVLVYTPHGDIIDMPVGANIIDFAYRIHSMVGNKCVGGKINGKMSPLDTPLKSGDIVEVLTSNASKGPSWDWLSIVKTPQARNKIRTFFKRERKDENTEKGKTMLEAAAKAQGTNLFTLMKPEWLAVVFRRFAFRDTDDMYAAVGFGAITANQVLTRLLEEQRKEAKPTPAFTSENDYQDEGKDPQQRMSHSHGVRVKGASNLLIRFARCCNPLPLDEIVGFVSRGRGVTVHRKDCTNLKNTAIDPGRFLPVEWEQEDAKALSFHAELHLNVMDRSGIFTDISKVVQSLNITLMGVNARVNKDHVVDMNLTVEINGIQQLEKLIQQLKKMPEMIEVFRVSA